MNGVKKKKGSRKYQNASQAVKVNTVSIKI